jgi:hypothetical protein
VIATVNASNRAAAFSTSCPPNASVEPLSAGGTWPLDGPNTMITTAHAAADSTRRHMPGSTITHR